MNLQPLLFDVNLLYRWRRDAQYSSRTKWILQRSCAFVLTAMAAGEQDLGITAASILHSVRIRQPHSLYMNYLRFPNLTNQPKTVYTRNKIVEGSDYEMLDPEVYDWKVVEAYTSLDDRDQVWRTIYVVQGQWDKYQGVAYGVTRREKG